MSKKNKKNVSKMPNPIRRNYDYGEDGYNYLDKVRKRLKKKKKKKSKSTDMTGELVKLANHLDSIGLHKEADRIDKIIKEASPLLWGLVLLCGGAGCVQLTEGQAEGMWEELRYKFKKDDPSEGDTGELDTGESLEPLAYDVYPVCEGGGQGCATVEREEGHTITITWPCADYEFAQKLGNVEEGKRGTYTASAQWDLYRDRDRGNEYYIEDETPVTWVRPCVLVDS